VPVAAYASHPARRQATARIPEPLYREWRREFRRDLYSRAHQGETHMPVHHKHLTREELIRALLKYAKSSPGPISATRFCTATKISAAAIYRHFASFPDFLAAAGPAIGDRLTRYRRASFPAMMEEFHRVATLLARTPTRADLLAHARIRPKTYINHIGPWPDVLTAYSRWLSSIGFQPMSPTPAEAPSPTTTTPSAPASSAPASSAPPPSPSGRGAAVLRGGEGSPSSPPSEPPPSPPSEIPNLKSDLSASLHLLGSPLGFRGLLHAPTNELGVIHLFGLLAPELNIAVEHIGAAFPDCRALRPEPCATPQPSGGAAGPCFPGATSGSRYSPWSALKWRRITIEFELKSSNFKAHGHDPTLCDLIVCWLHDWPDCPIEVIELKSIMAKAWGRAA
jgi:hypothetical protein